MPGCKAFFVALLALGFIPAGRALAADAYPNHTVTIVQPTPPGGGNDIAARIVAQQLSEMMPQKFVVENKPGAAGILGAKAVADAKPDGYTLLIAASTMTISPYLMPHLEIDVATELTPITEVASSAMAVIINPVTTPVRNLSELAAYAKANPDKFRWGGSLGAPSYFAIAQINTMSGMNSMIVPFSGAGPTLTSQLGGEVSAVVVVPSLVRGQLEAGQLRALAVTGDEIDELMPNVPTVAGSGPAYAGFDTTLWYGLWGPKGMPEELVMRVQQVFAQAMAVPDLRARYKLNGMGVGDAMTPQAFAAYVTSEISKNKAIIDAGHLRAAQ